MTKARWALGTECDGAGSEVVFDYLHHDHIFPIFRKANGARLRRTLQERGPPSPQHVANTRRSEPSLLPSPSRPRSLRAFECSGLQPHPLRESDLLRTQEVRAPRCFRPAALHSAKHAVNRVPFMTGIFFLGCMTKARWALGAYGEGLGSDTVLILCTLTPAPGFDGEAGEVSLIDTGLQSGRSLNKVVNSF